MYYELAPDTWGEEEQDAIARVMASGRFTIGPEVKAFEERFAAYHGRRHGVMTNSGSSANLLAVAAFCFRKEKPWTDGDEIIVPAVSWATTYHPLQQYRLKMRVVDINLDTLNLDVAQLEDALSPKTRGLVAVSILGNPARLDVMREFCTRYGLWLFEDNCESLDAELGGRKTGTFGDISTFSFFFSHQIATMEGGMLLTDDDEFADLARSMRAHGWTRDLSTESPVYQPHSGDRYAAYRFILPGYNVRPLEFSGAIGSAQLEKLPKLTAGRRRNLAHFTSLFAGDERFMIPQENGTSSSFCFPIILNPDLDPDRERVFATLEEAGIEHRVITGGNIVRHDVISHYDYEVVGATTNADILHDYGFFVGNSPLDLTSKIDRLHEVLDAAFSVERT